MTVGDIDDAMGWPHGTARRRRWRPPATGGLPAADAELGGVALWFRATWENWPRAGFGRHDPDGLTSRDAGDEVELTDLPDEGHTADADVEPTEDGNATTGIDHDEATEPEPGGTHGAGDEAGGAADDDGGVVDVDDDIDPVNDAGQGEEPEEDGGGDAAPPPVTSGFEFDVDQQVLAFAHGRWRKAPVRHRDRATVVVEYNLDPTPLGARRQRVGIDRVRPAARDC